MNDKSSLIEEVIKLKNELSDFALKDTLKRVSNSYVNKNDLMRTYSILDKFITNFIKSLLNKAKNDGDVEHSMVVLFGVFSIFMTEMIVLKNEKISSRQLIGLERLEKEEELLLKTIQEYYQICKNHWRGKNG